MSPERWLVWADRAYFGMAIVAAIATALTIVAGIAQNRFAARIAETKDRAFADFKLATQTQAQTLDAEVAAANARAAEANRIAEEERLARVKIQAKLSPRQLSGEQSQQLIDKMAGWARIPPADGVQGVAVFSTGSSYESAALADQIAAVLGEAAADWNVNRYPVTYGLSFSLAAVGVLTSSNPRGLQVAAALVQALSLTVS